MPFVEAALTCHQLGGMMPLPRSHEELEALTAFINESLSIGGKQRCQTYWLPIVQKEGTKVDKEEYEWAHYQFNINGKNINEKNKLIRYLPWKLGQPNGLEFQQCVVMAPKNQLYYDVDCKEIHCFVCSVCNQLHFTLRGLSNGLSKGADNRHGIDSRYIYISEFQDNEEIQLEGYYDHKINLNKDANQWEIVSVDNGTVGTLATQQHYPFGKHIWTINSSRIFGQDKTIIKKQSLKLSLVSTLIFI